MIIVGIAWLIIAYKDWASEKTSSIVLLEFTWFKFTKENNPILFNVCVAVEVVFGIIALYFGISSF